MKIAFRKWQKTWRKHITTFNQKCQDLNCLPFSLWPKGHIHQGRYYDVLPPHLIFTIGEKAIFKNMIAWMVGDESRGWYELPGPAEWWPNDYDFAKNR